MDDLQRLKKNAGLKEGIMSKLGDWIIKKADEAAMNQIQQAMKQKNTMSIAAELATSPKDAKNIADMIDRWTERGNFDPAIEKLRAIIGDGDSLEEGLSGGGNDKTGYKLLALIDELYGYMDVFENGLDCVDYATELNQARNALDRMAAIIDPPTLGRNIKEEELTEEDEWYSAARDNVDRHLGDVADPDMDIEAIKQEVWQLAYDGAMNQGAAPGYAEIIAKELSNEF